MHVFKFKKDLKSHKLLLKKTSILLEDVFHQSEKIRIVILKRKAWDTRQEIQHKTKGKAVPTVKVKVKGRAFS